MAGLRDVLKGEAKLRDVLDTVKGDVQYQGVVGATRERIKRLRSPQTQDDKPLIRGRVRKFVFGEPPAEEPQGQLSPDIPAPVPVELQAGTEAIQRTLVTVQAAPTGR